MFEIDYEVGKVVFEVVLAKTKCVGGEEGQNIHHKRRGFQNQGRRNMPVKGVDQ